MRPITVVAAAMLLLVVMAADAPPPPPRGRPPKAWASRRIYQLMTDRFAQDASPGGGAVPPGGFGDTNRYLGGTFKGVEAHLPFIRSLGFNAVWISPVVTNTARGYHGYWAKDIETVNAHFGSEQDLRGLVAAAHRLDVWVMADVVLNHMGYPDREGDFAAFTPFNETGHYHAECAVTNYTCQTREITHCRLAGLPDLDQTVPFVAAQLTAYMRRLLGLGFDGFRMDTVMYVNTSFWAGLRQAVGDVYIVGEVDTPDVQCDLDYTRAHGVSGVLDYPLFYALRGAFAAGGSMALLAAWARGAALFADAALNAAFVNNADNPLFLSLANAARPGAFRSALAFAYFTSIPIGYYADNADIKGNVDRAPLWETRFETNGIAAFNQKLAAVHEKVRPYESAYVEAYADDTFYCYRRGSLLACFTNGAAAQTRAVTYLPFDGVRVCDALRPAAPCVDGASTMRFTLTAGEPLVVYGEAA
jgi:alpha-amylase